MDLPLNLLFSRWSKNPASAVQLFFAGASLIVLFVALSSLELSAEVLEGSILASVLSAL
jgi:hypothetical protein